MSKRILINPFSKVNADTGFGTSNNYGGRFINRDGSFNIRKEGQPGWQRFSLFYSMLNLPLWKFSLALLFSYLIINVFFTAIYCLIGVDQLTGIVRKDEWGVIREVFYFSMQTFTTVGYGRINPVGDAANVVASLEALTGIAGFAIITGLVYGRFARPKAFLTFSDHALIAPFRGGHALMFRFASYKDNQTLTDVEIRVSAALLVADNNKSGYKFYDLSLERSKVDFLPMNWTVVHPIDENSPLQGLSEEDMHAADLEIYVLVRGFDEVFSNVVQQRTSYTYDEIKHGKKFVPMYRESTDGKTTVVELHKLNDYSEVVS
jgi:inward rectifier potassium channel